VGASGPEKVIRARALGVWAGEALWAAEKPEKRRGSGDNNVRQSSIAAPFLLDDATSGPG